MRRRLAVLAVAGVLVFNACSGNDGSSPTQPSFANQQNTGAIPATCDPARAEQLINEVFPNGQSRSSALSRLKQTVRFAGEGNAAKTRDAALRLVDFVLNAYFEGRLIGGTSTATANKVVQMLTEVLCIAGLPPFDPAALGLDAAAVVVFPNVADTVVTGTGFAGVQIDAGSVNEPTLITITRLPDSPGPLLTQFDQYPLFYEYHAVGTIPFNIPVIVSTCIPASLNPPDIDRIRLAHNVAPFTMGSIEVLDPVPGVTFVDCTTAQLGAAQRTRLEELAHHGFELLKSTLEKVALPAPLYAARYFGTGGISGSVRTFSPFGGVDPIGTLTPNADFTRTPNFGGFVEVVPGVTLTTPTGRVMEGIPVTWTVTAGGGTAGNGTVLTNAAGFASAGSWQFGFTNPQTLVATTTTPANTSIVGSPYQFNGLGH